MPFSLSFGAANVVFEIGVAAVDQDVARLHALGQGLHGLFGGTAGRNHQPGDSRLAQFADEVIERSGRDRAFAGHLLYIVSAQIGDHDFVPAAHQAARHVGAHLAQTDHSQTHKSAPYPILNRFYNTRLLLSVVTA